MTDDRPRPDPADPAAPAPAADLVDPAAAGALPPPPLDERLAAALRDLTPVTPRRPWRDLAWVAALAAAVVTALVLALSLRRDLDALPRAWVIAYGGAWLGAFIVGAWLALVPRAGHVVPRGLAAGAVAAVAAVGFVVAGLTLARTTPRSLVYAPTALEHLWRGAACAGLGTIAALAPLGLGARLLRGAVPVTARATGLGLGAACGAAGGLLLHLHCPITHPLHLGPGHGAAVVVGALAGALLVPALAKEPAS